MAEVENLPYHRKYRSETFAEYIGNEKMKRDIMNTLSSGTRPQAILIIGNSGCGKTTVGRLLAKEYNCFDRDAEKGACNECESCLAMNEYIKTGQTGVLANVHEVNIAEKRGVHDIDDIFEDIDIPVYGDEWKIYLFDECHKASNALQNRFLKIVEEPPDNVLFLFCTTNPEEMLETLKNRCQMTLKVTKPNVRELSGLLKKICMAEQVESDKAGLEFIANRSELTIRTALQNLWNVVQTQGSATYDAVMNVFDEVSGTIMADMFRALKSGNTMRYITLLCEVKSKMELEVFLEDLKGFVMRGVYTVNSVILEGVSAKELAVYRDLFADIGVAQLSYFLNRLLTINMRNLELELMALGYQGLNIKPVAGEENSEIKSLMDELALEKSNAMSVVQDKEEQAYEDGVANADKIVEGCGLDLLLQMGGVLVEQ